MCKRTVLLCLLLSSTALADEPQTARLRGRIVDEQGRPAAGMTVANLWMANGLDQAQINAVRSSDRSEAVKLKELYQIEGRMEPVGSLVATTDADGRFELRHDLASRKRFFLALTAQRDRGVLIRVHGEPELYVEAKLAPTTRIRGTVSSAYSRTDLWCSANLIGRLGDVDPLGADRIAICGSLKSTYEFVLPTGDYSVDAFAESPTSKSERLPITIASGDLDRALAPLTLKPITSIADRIARSKAKGTWSGGQNLIGREPPPWHVTDARGVRRDAKLVNFKGRWTLLYIWGPDCVPCLGRELPKMSAFYDAHRDQLDRFEILAFCCDFSETLTSIDALDRKLGSVRQNVWGGKPLPFPVLLDNTFQTIERLGLDNSALSSSFLIDPSGKVVEGGFDRLQEILKELPD